MPKPSMPAVLGFLSSIAAIVVLALIGVDEPVGWVLLVALVGWAAFAVRDWVRGRRAA